MPPLSPTQLREAEVLIARLEDDDVQRQLRSGFEQDFTNSVLDQWHERHWLSFEGRNGKRSQVEIIREIVERCEERGTPRSSRSGSGRRYEGWGR